VNGCAALHGLAWALHRTSAVAVLCTGDGATMHPVFRVGLLLLLGVVLLARALEMLNDRITAASQPRWPAHAVAGDAGALDDGSPGAVPAEPNAPPAVLAAASPLLPPPTEAQLATLRTGPRPAVAAVLRQLQLHQPTPALLDALDAAEPRVETTDARRLIACHRGRAAAAPLDPVFAALPDVPPADRAWRDPGASCLVQVIAARAHEDRERATPILVARAIESSDPAALMALASLDLPALPPEVEAALVDRAQPRRRAGAVGTALAIGAATKWPDRAADWLEDADREVRLHAIRALAFGTDEASRLAGARALAASAGDREIEQMADQALTAGLGLDRALAAVADDPSQPAFARDQARLLLSRHGGGAR
jgi:hypothetical protein